MAGLRNQQEATAAWKDGAMERAWLYIASGDDFANHHLKRMSRICYYLGCYLERICIHAEVEKITDITHMHANLKLKKLLLLKRASI